MSLGIASGAKSTVQSHNLPPLENVKNEQSILEILWIATKPWNLSKNSQNLSKSALIYFYFSRSDNFVLSLWVPPNF